MKLPQLVVRTAFMWLLVATAIGGLLRAWPVLDMPAGWQYRFFLHAHSHVLLLGWVFNLLYAGLLATHWRLECDRPLHRRLFWGFQLANLGMLVFFPIQGYAAGSIASSTLHLVLSAWVAVLFWRSPAPSAGAGWFSWAFVFMLLSALGPFALGYFKARHLEASAGYPLSIYFYLHLQYNGFFVFACIALAVAWAERRGLSVPPAANRLALRLMVGACFAGYALSALWLHPPDWVYWLGCIAAALQLGALWPLGRMARAVWPAFDGAFPRLLLRVAALAFGLKLLLQFASAFPVVADWAYADRNVVIAYLHLVLIGVVSTFLMGWMHQAGLARLHRGAMLVFLAFFAAHELWLGAGAVAMRAWGLALPGGPWPILLAAAGMWGALVGVGIRVIFTKEPSRSTF